MVREVFPPVDREPDVFHAIDDTPHCGNVGVMALDCLEKKKTKLTALRTLVFAGVFCLFTCMVRPTDFGEMRQIPAGPRRSLPGIREP